MDSIAWPALAAVFVLAGAVKGVTGMGLPTVAVSLLGLWLAPAQAAALLVLPSLATNVAQCRGPHGRRLLLRLWPAWLGLALVTVLLPPPAAVGLPLQPQQLLGLVLVAYGGWGLWRPRLPDLSSLARGPAAVLAAAVGALTGVVTAATAVFVFPLVPWLQCLRLEKDEMVQALGLSFTVATLALALRLQGSGAGASFVSWPAWLALGAAFAGLWLGGRLRARLAGPAFQRCLFAVFVALGLANLLKGG